MKVRRVIAIAVALAVPTAGASGCGHYEEPAVADPAMPPRPPAPVVSDDGPAVGVITGDVRVESLAASVAVAFETVGLFQDGKLLATSTTDGHGRFRFDKGEAAFYADGVYELTLLSDRYRGSSRIQYARFARRGYHLAASMRGSP